MSGPRRVAVVTGALVAGVIGVAIVALAVGRLDGGRRGEPVERFDPDRVEFGERARVEVLNAAGRSGLARAVTARLRDEGFDVVYYGNADGPGSDTSIVLLRAGDARAAHAVAVALGIDSVEVRPDPDLLLEVTVLLGRDFERR